MPNWVKNKLTISGPAEDLAQLVAAVTGPGATYAPSRHEKPSPASPKVFTLHGLAPAPAEIQSQTYARAGYEWQIEKWGTKWDACDPVLDTETGTLRTWRFRTAWSIPGAALLAGSIRWPRLRFSLSWIEEDVSFGRSAWEGGYRVVEIKGEASMCYDESRDQTGEDEAYWDRRHDEREQVKRIYYDSHEEWVGDYAEHPVKRVLDRYGIASDVRGKLLTMDEEASTALAELLDRLRAGSFREAS